MDADQEEPVRLISHYAPVYRSRLAEKYNDQYDSGVACYVVRCPWCGIIVDSPYKGGHGKHVVKGENRYCGLYQLSLHPERVEDKLALPYFKVPKPPKVKRDKSERAGRSFGLHRRVLHALRRCLQGVWTSRS